MAARIHSQRRLIDLLAETGPLAPAQAQALLRSLAAEAATLLADGRPAEQVGIGNIWVDDRLQPVFASDAQMDVLEATTRTKQKVESGAGQERAMVFQLGCIACELLTGETADAYLVSPRVKRQLPGPWRPIVDRMLGYDPATRLTTLEELHAAMSSLLEPQNSAETPRHGTGVDVTGNTPLAALPAAARRSPEQLAEPLPFSMLGHYRVEAKIGSGGMGDVYRGFEPALERTVALKVLPAELARQQDFVRRFEDEAKAAARLVHPNIVQIYFIGEDAGRHFFAMQYVAGESLASRLAREKRLPTADALALVEQLLEGLSVAHTRGMIHRDIKPSNILLDGEQGRALLADFGLVKSLDGGTHLTATGMVMGTVDYLSPEQGRGLPVDARSDLYSVGVLLYQLLSGRLPFESNSATAMIFQHAYERPRRLTDVASWIPEGVSRLVHRLLEKDPRDRYASAEELLVDVRGLRASPDFEAPPRANENPSAASSWLLSDVDDQLTTLFPPIPSPGWRDRWRLLLHRRAPRLLQRLQNTEQQMDGAIAVYQARRDQLSQLADEAAAVTKQLAADLEDQRRAGDGSSAGELEQMLAEHQAQLDDLHLRKAQADAALEKLRNQQAVLRARLQVATAGQALAGAGDHPRKANWRRAKSWLLAAAIAAVLVILLAWNSRPEDPATPLVAGGHAPTAPIVSSWIDLLSTVQLPEDILGGNWKQVQDGLKIDSPSGAQRLQLPVQINGSYDLRLQFTRGNGAPNRGLSVSLPVGNRRVNVVIGQVNGHGVGIAGINRFTAFHNDNPAADKRVEVLPDVRHDALISVRLDGALAKIAVALDDVQRVEWSGQQSELNLPASMDRTLSDVPILAAWGNDVTFHHIDLRMIDGKANVIRGGEAPLAADLLEPRQPQAPSPLEGYFHVACKGAFALLINGRPVFANTEQKPFAGTSDRVTLQQGDVVSVRFNSKYVYRAIRLAFVDVNRKWLWSAQREDFRVTKDVDPAEVSAELIAASNLLPDFGRVDWDSGSVDGWDLLIENDTSDWLWAGGKNVWAMYSAVVRPELFAPYKIVIPTHRSRWEPPQNAGAVVNSPSDDAGPFLAADGKALLFHSNRDGGQGDFDLYMSRRDSVDQAWQTPEPLGGSLNTSAADCFPRLSADGLTLLFCSTREGGAGRRDMYLASRASVDEPWGPPTPLEAPLNTEYDDGPGWLSPDGLSLWFSSDRPGGEGKSDVWHSQRVSVNDRWGEPSIIRWINTSGNQQHPTASSDGQLLIIDARWKSGFGQADLWSWRRPKTPFFQSALNLGATINTKLMEADPALSADGESLWFASNRPGGQGKLDVWVAAAGRSRLQSPPTGTWKLLLPSGAQRPLTLTSAGNNAFELQTGGVVDGIYQWRNGLLTVERPKDPRYVGLAWEWQGDKLVLVNEPPEHPSGGVYMGATMEFVSSETSAEARSAVPTLPARSFRLPETP